jgi:cysteine-S-conjugate beta-lyase
MTKSSSSDSGRRGTGTKLVNLGRNPSAYHGFVNTPIFRGSTILFQDMESFRDKRAEYTYGRRGTPTVRALEEAVTELEGGATSVVTPSGLSAIACAFLSIVEAGDHILVSDSVYQPARRICSGLLKRLGVETTFYDPLVGKDIAGLIRDNTRLVYTESPGSQTFEMQDLPAIAEAAHARGAIVIADNTWATPLYYNPLALGADIVVHAGTKYFGGHADVNLGTVTANAATADAVRAVHGDMGICAAPEDVFLSLRGLRTLAVRLQHHQAAAIEMAEWFAARPEVERVLHPALPGDPGHAIWKRDFRGSSGLFSVILKPASREAVCAMVDDLELFGIGASWGSFESLVLPFDPAPYRTATAWKDQGPALRFHIGLEDLDDLKADLDAGFERLSKA